MLLIEYRYLIENIQNLPSVKEKRWFLVSSDYSKLKKLFDTVLTRETYIDTYDELLASQENYRDAFIRFIGELGRKYDSFQWWVSGLAEKNVLIEDTLFLKLCMLKLIEKYKDDDIMVVSDDCEFLDTAALNASNAALFKVKRKSRIRNILKRYWKSRRRFFSRYFWGHYSSGKQQPLPGKEYIALMSWVDDRNFDRDGTYKDEYFKRLFDRLKTEDNFLYLPYCLSSVNKAEVLAKLQNNNVRFADVIAFRKKIDVIVSLINALFSPGMFDTGFRFAGVDATPLIKKRIYNDVLQNTGAEYCLFYLSVKRLQRSGIRIKQLVYPFENQCWEKGLCYAFRQWFPGTRLIGYMHVLPAKNYVSIFISAYERERMPLPDKIFTIGKLSADIFRQYYHRDTIVENCAFRYNYLFAEKNIVKQQRAKKNILAVMSIIHDKSLAMLEKIIYAFHDENNYAIFIKPHPVSPLNLAALGVEKLPVNMTITAEPVAVLLETMDLVINLDSSVCLEALKFQVPVLEVEVENYLQLSRMDYFQERITARTPRDILNKAGAICNWSDEQKRNYFSAADTYLTDCFNQVSEKYIDAFLAAAE